MRWRWRIRVCREPGKPSIRLTRSDYGPDVSDSRLVFGESAYRCDWTAIIDGPAHGFVPGLTIRTMVVREDLLSAAAAFGLGYFVYRRWKCASSKWVWLAGVCWFAGGALLTLDGNHGTVFWKPPNISLLDFNVYDADSLSSFENWSGYMLPLVRTIFYSTGAFCCSHLGGAMEASILNHARKYTGAGA
jgi:hypothetical protein